MSVFVAVFVNGPCCSLDVGVMSNLLAPVFVDVNVVSVRRSQYQSLTRRGELPD